MRGLLAATGAVRSAPRPTRAPFKQPNAVRRLERFQRAYAEHREDACSNCACQEATKTAESANGFEAPEATGGGRCGAGSLLGERTGRPPLRGGSIWCTQCLAAAFLSDSPVPVRRWLSWGSENRSALRGRGSCRPQDTVWLREGVRSVQRGNRQCRSIAVRQRLPRTPLDLVFSFRLACRWVDCPLAGSLIALVMRPGRRAHLRRQNRPHRPTSGA